MLSAVASMLILGTFSTSAWSACALSGGQYGCSGPTDAIIDSILAPSITTGVSATNTTGAGAINITQEASTLNTTAQGIYAIMTLSPESITVTQKAGAVINSADIGIALNSVQGSALVTTSGEINTNTKQGIYIYLMGLLLKILM